MRSICMLVAALAVGIGSMQAFGGAEETKQARAVFEKNKDAVVYVTAAAKFEISSGGRSANQERKIQAIGTIIEATGLTVMPLSSIDPGAMMDGKPGQDGQKMSIKSEHSEVKIVLPPSAANPNGLEVPARIALKDVDLNLAFVIPTEPAKSAKPVVFPFVKLDKTPKLQELDPLVCISRMAKALDQAPEVSISEVAAIVKKPRPFVIGGQNLGGPVFTLDGTAIGITTVYTSESAQAPTTVVLPAEDVMDMAKQAKEAKPAPATPPASTTPADGESTSKPAKSDTPAPAKGE